jgi:hypothetical protein
VRRPVVNSCWFGVQQAAMHSLYGSRLASAIRRLAKLTSDVELSRILRADRRRIKALRLNSDGATLSLGELNRLDQHLHGKGYGGIAGFIDAKPTVFQSLVRCSEVCLLLGSRVDDASIERISLHDFKAAMDLQETLTSARTSSQLPPQVFRTKTHMVGDATATQLPIESPRGTAWLSFGAPISNPFTEALLARMLDGWAMTPFQLVFPDKPRPPSRFILHAPRRSYRGVQISGGKRWDCDETRSYGIVVAQLDPSSQLRIACLGTTGAATKGAVQVLADLSREVPSTSEQILIAAVEVAARDAGDRTTHGTAKVAFQTVLTRDDRGV